MSQNIYISPLYRWVLHQQFQQVTRRKTRGKPSNFCCLKSLFLPKRSYCLCSFWSWEVTPVSGVIRSPEWCRHVSNVTLTSWWHDSHYTMMLKTGWQGLNRTTSRAVNIHWICKCVCVLWSKVSFWVFSWSRTTSICGFLVSGWITEIQLPKFKSIG